jgi:hypothetical protein
MQQTFRIAVGVRFYEEHPEKLRVVEKFIRRISPEVNVVIVAVNDAEDKTGASEYLKRLDIPKAEIFSVNAWGKFTPALNAIVYLASARGCTHVLFCSPEIDITPVVICALCAHMDSETLVVGASLEGHEFSEGTVLGNGTTVPWNTLALWNLAYLARTGFLLAGDAPFDPFVAGVEELSTCAALQTLYPRLQVKLVQIPGITWDAAHGGLRRVMAHLRKMHSKKDRAARQLAFIELSPPSILHIVA